MTTQEFIKKTYGVTSDRGRHCSSVIADNQGNIYSYGQHYPLLFSVGGLTFRNCTGYSNTTSRHISLAGGHDAIDVWLSGCNLSTWNSPENAKKVPQLLHLSGHGMTPVIETMLKMAIVEDLDAELADIKERMASKKRKDTKTFNALEDELTDCDRRIELINEAWGE
jgi:hypothetical protein